MDLTICLQKMKLTEGMRAIGQEESEGTVQGIRYSVLVEGGGRSPLSDPHNERSAVLG